MYAILAKNVRYEAEKVLLDMNMSFLRRNN